MARSNWAMISGFLGLLLTILLGSSCASPPSSADEALSYPSETYLGAYRFDVDPSAKSVEVTPVSVSAWSTNPIGGDGSGNITNARITTLGGISWNPGTGTIDFRVKVVWLDPLSHLENVSLQISSVTGDQVILVNQDRGYGPILSNLPNVKPTITYVSDSLSDGPETMTICENLTCASSPIASYLHAECGSLIAEWKMREPRGYGFTFWASLYGDVSTIDLLNDPRYDSSTASIFLRTYKMDSADSTYPAEAAATQHIAAGEWFYAHYYVDAPGAGGTGTTPGPSTIEDAENIAAFNGSLSSTADYWYMSQLMPWSIRWDPAVIEINSNFGIPPGNGKNAFTTTEGTLLRTVNDVDINDGWNALAVMYTASNSMGLFMQMTSSFQARSDFYPYPGDGLDGFGNHEWDVGYISLHARDGLSLGWGSPIKISYDSHTLLVAYRTMGTPYYTFDDQVAEVPKSASWPSWCELLPNGECDVGQYNAERGWVCIE